MQENENQSLEVMPRGESAVARPANPQPLTLQQAWEAVKTGDLSSERLEVMQKLLKMSAEQQFSVALAKLQADVKNVKAIRPVTIKGVVRYQFAPYEDLMSEVAPHLAVNGFTISYSTRFEHDRVIKTLNLRHVAGHVQINEYSTKVSRPIENREGGQVVSEAQMESMAGTTAKRGALCDALNIVIEKYEQNDERELGSYITVEQAKELKAQVAGTGTVEKSFLEFANAPDYEHIYSSRYRELKAFLDKRERLQKKSAAQSPKTIGADVARQLRDRVLATGADWVDFLKPFNVAKFEEIPAASLEAAILKVAKLEGK